ncbi:MAG: fibro-slime domain-containing protein, partial [Planctomycetota bacterium]
GTASAMAIAPSRAEASTTTSIIWTMTAPGLALASAGGVDDGDGPPATIKLTGIVRDFHERSVSGGHPDFERPPNAGFGHYIMNIDPALGADGKPKFTGGGRRVTGNFRDASNRNICWTLYDPSRGDKAAALGAVDNGGITSAESFEEWYTDVPGVNLSEPLTLTLVRQSDGTYVFDDRDDPMYSSLGGFFPINERLFGNSAGNMTRNFHFTFELRTTFTYNASANQVFEFRGDDDVWVFIDNQLVIDIGGVHGAITQAVELDRLGLTDGEEYSLMFFFAERHRTQSNFRFTTNFELKSLPPIGTTLAFD